MKNNTEKPVLFKTDMVQSIMEDIKRMTRRTKGLEKVNEKPDDYYFQSLVLHASGKFTFCPNEIDKPRTADIIECKPQYNAGDLMWVKENFWPTQSDEYVNKITRMPFIYKADFNSPEQIEDINYAKKEFKLKWKPSVFMPKDAARIWLRCTEVRAERLNDITEADALAEGVKSIISIPGTYKHYCPENYYTKEQLEEALPWVGDPRQSFLYLWESINGKESVDLNPWVFVYSFEVVSKTGKAAICM